jgi:serine/threonine protein kinase
MRRLDYHGGVFCDGAKLLDFGMAKPKSNPDEDAAAIAEGTVLGTGADISPEQAQGTSVRIWFSFGAVLCEMLSGKWAFGANSVLETLNAVVHDEPASLESPMSAV